MNFYLIVVFLYIAFMVTVSIIKSLKVKDQQDFVVSKRNVSTFMMITTLIATWTGAGSLIGGAGLAYRQGLSELWMSVGGWFAIIIIYWLAGRVRHISKYTLPDILEKRYNGAARLLGSMAIIIGCTTIVGYQFKGGAYILELVAGIPWHAGVTIIAIMAITLTALAGMKSIMALDLINGILIIVGILIAVPMLILNLGGVSSVVAAIPPEHLSLFGGRNIIWAAAVFSPVFLLLLGEPSMYQKFSSAKNEKTARKAVAGWIVGIVIVDFTICLLAILGRIKFPNLGAEGHAERVILDIARFGIPQWAGCILLAASMAIVFSTANSFLMAPATNIAHDIIKRFISKDISSKKMIALNRITIAVLGLTAYILLTHFRNVLSMALAAYTMIGAGITPAILAVFFWKRVTTAGGISSILGGMLGTIAAKLAFDIPTVQMYFSQFGIPGNELGEYIIIPAFILATLLLIVVSLLGKPPSENKWKPFFAKSSKQN